MKNTPIFKKKDISERLKTLYLRRVLEMLPFLQNALQQGDWKLLEAHLKKIKTRCASFQLFDLAQTAQLILKHIPTHDPAPLKNLLVLQKHFQSFYQAVSSLTYAPLPQASAPHVFSRKTLAKSISSPL